MRILYYDCFSGISGDMNLAAMLDLGIEESWLRSELQKLKLEGWDLEVGKDQRHGIYGTKLRVIQTIKDMEHRHMSDIENLINSSSLDKKVKELSLTIFGHIARAEAKVHNTTVDKIHFHEVGAIDSIIDIVGAALCFNKLDVDQVHVREIELGSGFVKCAHGNLPVPAPATAEIVKDMPVSTGGVKFEATTPTGAAILKTIVSGYEPESKMSIHKTGYGIGHKENPDRPNLLRVYLGESLSTNTGEPGSFLLECNLDDMNPEWYEHLITRLLESGASDAFLTNIIMKQGRPGVKVSVLVKRENIESIKECLYKNSTTLGLRILNVDKHSLEREFKEISTPYGKVGIKLGYYNKELVSVKPEHADCLAIAKKDNLSLQEVTRIVLQSFKETQSE